MPPPRGVGRGPRPQNAPDLTICFPAHPGHRLHPAPAPLGPALLPTAPAGSELAPALRFATPRGQMSGPGHLQELAIRLEPPRSARRERPEQHGSNEQGRSRLHAIMRLSSVLDASRLTTCKSAAGDHVGAHTNQRFLCLASGRVALERSVGPPRPVGCICGLGSRPRDLKGISPWNVRKKPDEPIEGRLI